MVVTQSHSDQTNMFMKHFSQCYYPFLFIKNDNFATIKFLTQINSLTNDNKIAKVTMSTRLLEYLNYYYSEVCIDIMFNIYQPITNMLINEFNKTALQTMIILCTLYQELVCCKN